MIKNLRALREMAKMSRSELGKELGLTENQIYSYEREKKSYEPSYEVTSRIADFFGVSVDELLGRSISYSAKPPSSVLDIKLFGKRIQARREELGLSLKVAAKNANITPSYLSVVEQGKKIPKTETCINLLNSLNMSADSAFCDSLLAAHNEKATYLQYELKDLDPERRFIALKSFELILKSLK